ncbi:MAG TPA: hypothetical protein PLV42_07150 [bacterium]|nr:hypothetical protein [bacterium]
MKYGVLIIACVLLASCATMKNGHTRPTEELCWEKYYSAKTGEKLALAGVILIPVGGVLIGASVPLILIGTVVPSAREMLPGGVTLGTVGGMAILGGIMSLVAGHRSVNRWNDYCAGATVAERYCLFEPLPTSSGETP